MGLFTPLVLGLGFVLGFKLAVGVSNNGKNAKFLAFRGTTGGVARVRSGGVSGGEGVCP